MLRFLFCLIFIAPVFFIPSLLGNHNADASVEVAEDTYDTFTDSKISSLDKCEPESIPIYFSDAYVETHSAEFLHDAVSAASTCNNTTVRIVNLNFENMSESELLLAKDQVKEVAEFVKAYDVDIDIERSVRNVDLDTRAVNGRSVIVEFEFDPSMDTASAAQ